MPKQRYEVGQYVIARVTTNRGNVLYDMTQVLGYRNGFYLVRGYGWPYCGCMVWVAEEEMENAE